MGLLHGNPAAPPQPWEERKPEIPAAQARVCLSPACHLSDDISGSPAPGAHYIRSEHERMK